MSVLRVPRLFLKGTFYWNPDTTNNNDQWPTYDFPNADLNWPFLATQDPPITRENFTTTFKPWAVALKDYPTSQNCQYQQPPAEWNYFGGNDCGLVTAGTPMRSTQDATTITGGQTAYGADPSSSDPVIGQPVMLAVGTKAPGAYSAPKMVDVNPDSFWCTQVILSGFQIGTPSDSSQPSLQGSVPPGSVMTSRWIYFQRNLNADGTIEIAGVGGATFQIGLPWLIGGQQSVLINAAGSNLLTRLAEAQSDPTTQGVMVRLTAYTTIYFQSQTILAACPDLAQCIPLTGNAKLQCQYEKLAALWEQQLQALQSNPKAPPPSQNPAFSTTVGSIGLWDLDELATAPQGRYLSPRSALSTVNLAKPKLVTLAPAVARLDGDWVSLDMSATISEINPANEKASFGNLDLGVTDPQGKVSVIGTLTPTGYDRANYVATAGIVDFSLLASPDKVTPEQVRSGQLVLRGTDAAGSAVTALTETADKLTVDTDQRGVYVDQGQTGSCTVQVRHNGLSFAASPPPANVKVLLAQYRPDPPPPQAAGGSWALATSKEITVELDQDELTLDANSNGQATFSFKYLRPGFPIIVFFPYFEGQPAPTPPAGIGPLSDPTKPITSPNEISLSAFYMTIRCMPANNDMPQKFVDLWNETQSQQLAWEFVYQKILFLYDMVFPVMQYYAGINFGDMNSVIANWKYIAPVISRSNIDATDYMPVTRQLSNGARFTLQLWGQLVDNQFEPVPLSLPAEWAKDQSP